MKYKITPRREIYNRISQFQKKLQESDIRGVIITQNTDLYYFSGTIQRSLLFIPQDGEPVLAVNGNIERATDESKLKNILPLKNSHEVDKVLKPFNFQITGKIGLEFDVLPASYYLSFREDYRDVDFIDISEMVRKTRMIKSEYELKWIRQACQIQDEVMHEAQNKIRLGMGELDVDAMLSGYARRKGHQGFFRCRGYNQEINCCHILAGADSALATYVKGPLGGKGITPNIPLGASYNIISENQPIIIDFGVGINGYVSDMTRTFVIGKLPKELQEAHKISREVKHFMESRVKPGISCAELYHEIIKMVQKTAYAEHFMGYGKYRVAFVGHGIGLELDEYPVIAPNFKVEFQENMVYAFEPKFAFPGIGAVGVEDDFVVTSNGVERLTLYDDKILNIKGQ